MLKQLTRIGISLALAGMILTVFGFFYSNTPLQYTDADGATDYLWEADKFYSHGTEGFSFGFTNNEGYYNLRDRAPGEAVDILIMGSSQLEASNVPMEKATASLLDEAFSEKTVYNISISAHTFLYCVEHLDAALAKYKPKDYVIIEAERAAFADDELQDALQGRLPALFAGRGEITEEMRKNPYLTLLGRQARNYLSSRAAGKPDRGEDMGTGEDSGTVPLSSPDPLSSLMVEIAETAKRHHTQVIVLYHPATAFYEADGEYLLSIDDQPGAVQTLETLCDENGILFLDMSDRFLNEYETRHILPHGFSNTAVGAGHLNTEGHAMVADELIRLIGDSE